MNEIRLWKIHFGTASFLHSTRVVEANNAKEAMRKSLMKKNRPWVGQTLHNITKVELIAETD